MTIDLLQKMLLPVTDLLEENISLLTELDSATGDGDHGVTIGKISMCIRSKLVSLDGSENPAEVLDTLSWDLMNINGGSAGPLWGAYFEGMAEGAALAHSSEDEFVRNILIGGYENFASVSGAKVGDKTMMDAIYPAVETIRAAEKTLNDLMPLMAEASSEGAEDTKNMIAKFGRARSLKEKAIGHADPGAVSFSLFFKGIAQGLSE